MTLVHIDSFEQGAGPYQTNLGSGTFPTTPVRYTPHVWKPEVSGTSYYEMQLSGSPTKVGVTFWMYVGALPTSGSQRIWWGWNGSEVRLHLNTDGTIDLDDNGTTVGTTTGTVNTGAWNRIDLKFDCAAATAYELRLNLASELSGSRDFAPASVATTNCGWTGAADSSIVVYFSDHWIDDAGNYAPAQDTSGIRVLRPTGTGNYDDFSGSYTDVDDSGTNDGDTTYRGSSSSTDKFTQTFEDIDTILTVSGVQGNRVARWVTTSTNMFQLWRSGGSDYTSPIPGSIGGTSAWQFKQEMRTVDPFTSSAWTASGVNALEFGQQSSFDGAERRVTQIFLEVWAYDPNVYAAASLSLGVSLSPNGVATHNALASLQTSVSIAALAELLGDTGLVTAGSKIFASHAGNRIRMDATVPVGDYSGQVWIDTRVAGQPVIRLWSGTQWVNPLTTELEVAGQLVGGAISSGLANQTLFTLAGLDIDAGDSAFLRMLIKSDAGAFKSGQCLTSWTFKINGGTAIGSLLTAPGRNAVIDLEIGPGLAYTLYTGSRVRKVIGRAASMIPYAERTATPANAFDADSTDNATINSIEVLVDPFTVSEVISTDFAVVHRQRGIYSTGL